MKNSSSAVIFQKGFTLIELLLSMAVITILFGLVTFNVIGALRSTSVAGATESLMADIKKQQIKAMNGTSQLPTSGDSFGIFFQPDRYVLFHGTTFVATDESNSTVILDNNIQLSSSFSGNTLIFSQLSGEILSFSTTSNTVLLKDVSGTEQKQITFNKYGVITDIH